MTAGAEAIDEAMARYANGEDAAFSALYAALSRRLYAFCIRLCTRRAEADDLLQETFLKLHRSRSSYVPGSTALHWAFAIARSVYLDRLRYRRRRPEDLTETGELLETYSSIGPSPSAGDTPESQAQAREVMVRIERVIRELPENQRAAFVLLKEEGLSVNDAAAILGATPTAVKLRAHRAYEAIRAALAEDRGSSPPAPRAAARDPGGAR